MSDTTDTKETPAPESQSDSLKNLKEEFSRKLGNVENSLKSSNEALLAQIQSMMAPKQAPKSEPEADLETLMYSKPAEAVRRIKDEAKRELRTELDTRDSENAKRQTAIQGLYKEYPELAIDDSELTTKSIARFNEISKEFGNSPMAYRAAVAEIAQELGVKPKSKRPPSEDDFQLSGSNRGRGQPSKASRLSPAIEEVARKMGVDPKRVLDRANKRTNFSSWE